MLREAVEESPVPGIRTMNDTVSTTVFQRLEHLGIRPNESLGQHFLIDDTAIDLLASSVSSLDTVIEIGSGVGQLTEALAQRAKRVISVEIDKRYQPVLQDLLEVYKNLDVIYANALDVDFSRVISSGTKAEDVQIVASLPYHITEPFLHKLISFPFHTATLVVGDRLKRTVQAANERDPDFSKLTLLAQTFFHTDVVAKLGKKQFYPVPRTDSAIVRFIPKDPEEIQSNRHDFIVKRFFLTARKNPLVKNCLREALIEFSAINNRGTLSKREHHQRTRSATKSYLRTVANSYTDGDFVDSSIRTPDVLLTQNQARKIIDGFSLPESLLNTPFEQLNNTQLQDLSRAIR